MIRMNQGNETSVQRNISLPLYFIIFFSVLNGMMFQVAVPDISADFDLLPSEVSWVMTGYILIFALGTLIFGKLADTYSSRNLITTGLLLMNVGSLIGLFSQWYPMLIVARLTQAAGGAAIPALAMTVVTRYFPVNSRGRVLGMIASTVALAAGVGPILGGLIAGTLHWRYLFITSLATLAMIPCFRIVLPADSGQSAHFDKLGASLVGGGTSLLLVAIAHDQWWLLPVGIFLYLWFIIHIRRVEKPFVNPSIFVGKQYRNTVISTFLSIGTVFGMLFMVPIMLREMNSMNTESIGLVIFPGAMSAFLLGALGGRLSDRRGSKFVFYMGSAVMVTGFFLLSTFAGHQPWTISIILVVVYAGFSFLQSSLPHTVSISLPDDQIGIGMGIYNLMFFISGAFMTAGIGRLLDFRTVNVCINPIKSSAVGCIFSNIFVMLALIAGASSVLFYLTFKRPDGILSFAGKESIKESRPREISIRFFSQ
jgi:DHA2 family metal-tetracycline-proton antiporter-like MFS transporter